MPQPSTAPALALNFGGTLIPCSLSTQPAAQELLPREHFHRPSSDPAQMNRVNTMHFDAVTGEQVEPGQLRTVTLINDQPVEFDDSDLAAAAAIDMRDLAVDRFVPLHFLGTDYSPHRSYFIRPHRTARGPLGGRARGSRQGFALLMRALVEEKMFALLVVVLEGDIRYAALTGDGRLTTLLFESERGNLPEPELHTRNDAAMDAVTLARCVVVQRSTNFAPRVDDTFGPAVVERLQRRQAGTVEDTRSERQAVAADEGAVVEEMREYLRSVGLRPAAAPSADRNDPAAARSAARRLRINVEGIARDVDGFQRAMRDFVTIASTPRPTWTAGRMTTSASGTDTMTWN